MIGRLLGHTQIGTTPRYAHLIDAPLRAGVNAVGEMLKPRLRVVGAEVATSVAVSNHGTMVEITQDHVHGPPLSS